MRRLVILMVMVASPVFLGAEQLPIRTYTTADGLASNRVNCIVADSRGFLWFCTPEGLSRFDGNRFVNYGVVAGLPDQAVLALHESRAGDHWMGTGKGLSRIDSAHFANYDPGQAVVALAESRSGGMWAATKSSILEWRDPLHVRRRPVPFRPTSLLEDASGNLWVGTATSGIFLSGRNLTAKSGLPGEWVEMLLRDSRGRVWAALRGGLVQFSLNAEGKWAPAKIYTDTLAGTDVKAVAEASDGTLWVGTTRGISRLRWNGTGDAAIENLSRAQGLSDRSITSLAEDQAGNMWVGTESGGVMRIGRLGFATYREQDGLGSDRVWSVLQDAAGEIVAVTIPEKGMRTVDVYDGARFRSVAPKAFSDNSAWAMNQVLLQSRAGEWWGATGQGLCRFGSMKAVDLDRRKPRVCYAADAMIFSIFEDSKGGIWASARSGHGDRLMRWSPETNAVFQFAYPPGDLAGAFAEDREGNIWMGLYKGGLVRYDGRELRYFQKGDGVPAGPVLALLATGSGLWIGTEGGGLGRLEKLAERHPRVEVYNAAGGMASDIIQCLVEDRAGHIYAGTGKGVDRLDPGSGHILHFSNADGLPLGTFHGAVCDRSGALWFATTQGLARLIPTEEPAPSRPHILITDLRIGGETYPVSRLGETRIVAPAMQPAQNQLLAEFAGIDYRPGDVVRYSYKLEGADSKWSVPRNQQSVSYAALGSGHYRLWVKAVTSEGAESAAPAVIDFTVLPPVWKRWWFVSLAAALAAALVLAAHRYRVSRIVGLERMRTSIATDLHDDIGASLSQIAILSEVARGAPNGKGTGEALERIAVLARELVDSMGDIVWSIRSEPRGWDSLIRHMREFALDVLTSQGIDFQLRAPQSGEGAPMSLQLRRQLFLMFKECIHNAARHSRCTAVVAELRAGSREVVLTVEDDGIGFDADEKRPNSGGTGIAGMRRRAQGLGGSMQWISAPGHGCRGEIRLPLRRGS